MGFRKDSYAKVWEIKPYSDSLTKIRVSTSRKNKTTDSYEQDFSGWVGCAGTACAKKAMGLIEGARIKIGDVDVTNRYDKEKGVTYTNFTMFSFECQDESPAAQPANEPQPEVDDGFVDESALPF